jgi:5-formyltetrahydrofolate cyclo-ligase
MRTRRGCNRFVRSKDELRFAIRQRLRALDATARALASAEICVAIEAQPDWTNARLVCGFLPLPTEPAITSVWTRPGSPAFCFPRVRGARLDLVTFPKADLLVGATWRMAGLEFDALPTIDLAEVDLLLVPGLAFTRDGRRLGRGGGYYDRLLAARDPRATTFGVCFDAQLVDDLPIETHDRSVARVITESGAV